MSLKHLYIIATLIVGGILGAIIFSSEPVAGQALQVFRVSQGGTGWGNITADTLLTGNGTVRLATTSIGSGLSLSGGVLTATAAAGSFPFTPTSYGNSTSSVIAFTAGIISQSSTTIPVLGSGLVGANNGLLYGFASSSLFGYTPLNPTRALTIAGTANQLTSSAGGQNLL